MRFSELDGATVGVWGAGREVASFADQLARRLPAARIAVAAFDAPPAEDVLDRLKAPGARIVTGAEIVPGLSDCDVVVRSPGVSIYRPELHALRETGKPVTTATALWLAEHGSAGVIGITGTKGKSTTAALAHHLARAAGRTAQLAGNIGVPALDLLDADPAEVIVLELSSYHTADLDTGPEVALVTNLFREHTDWHGSEEAYRADKLRLLRLPGVRRVVLNGRDERLVEVVDAGSRPAVDVRLDYVVEPIIYGVPPGWDSVNGGIAFRDNMVAAPTDMPLRGEHNALNLCGALTALEALGVKPPMPASLRGFQPLAHRLETVVEREGVLWVNDSISTTPESTLAALASFPGREIVLIAGGQDRGQDYSQLGRALAQGEITVIGVPSTGMRLLADARAAGLPSTRAIAAADMPEAVEVAHRLAGAGAAVLLSPAAPSYDHYCNFEERGERFRGLVGRARVA